MAKEKKIDEKKQLTYLLIILAVLIIFTISSKIFLNFGDEEIQEENLSETTQETQSAEITNNSTKENTVSSSSRKYTINGMTQEEWENVKAYINEDVYDTVMELFGEGLTEDITIDTDSIISGENESSSFENAITQALEEYENEN